MAGKVDMKNVDWKQSADEEDTRIEIRIPFPASAENRAKDLAVVVKDSQVLIVTQRGGEDEFVRWRLHDLVQNEVEWAVEDKVLVLDVEKKNKSSWPCLLCQMIAPTDPILLTEAELDRLLATEYKPLPKSAVAAAKKEAAAADGDDDDIDKLLDEAADEAGVGGGDSNEEASEDPYIQVELRGLADDDREMRAKLRELQEQLENAGEDVDVERAQRHIGLLNKMLEVTDQIREVRTEPASIRSFLKAQQLDLRKGRLNIGDTSEAETEQFASDEERAMAPEELFRSGLKALQGQELEDALHFLRLAAIHHGHSSSVCILNRIYTEMGVAQRAAYFLIQRALDDKDLDVATNLLCGEMFDRGMRHFPPLMAMAVYFYQRAARGGSVNAMLSLAQIFSRGACSVSFGMKEVQEGNRREPKFHAWLELACSRGAGSAYFVMGSLYLRGEHGKAKDYEQAKFWMDKAGLSQPEVIKRLPQIAEQLQRLKQEQHGGSGGSDSASGSASGSPTTAAKSTVRVTDVDRSGVDAATRSQTSAAFGAVRPRGDAASRLEQVEQQTGGGARSMMDPRGSSRLKSGSSGSGAASKRFWERTTVVAFGTFCVYTVAFPLRVMLLPYFYMVVGNLLDMFAGFGASAPTTRPRMF